MDRKQHWEDVYGKKKPTEVSWYQAEPTLSLSLLNEATGAERASIIDVGGGASTLIDRLVDRVGEVAVVAVAHLDPTHVTAGDGAEVIGLDPELRQVPRVEAQWSRHRICIAWRSKYHAA